jgi:hypothetical protein
MNNLDCACFPDSIITRDPCTRITDIPSVDSGGTLVIHAQKGFGKSVALRLLKESTFRGLTIIHINFSRTLSYFSATKRGPDVHHYATGEGGLAQPLLEVVVNSLPRVKRIYDVVILDEAVSIMESIASDLVSPSHRLSILSKLMTLLKAAKYVILADAGTEPYTVHMVRTLRGKHTILRFLDYTFRPNEGHVCKFYEGLLDWQHALRGAAVAGKNIVIACMTIKMVKHCAALVRSLGLRSVQVYYDGSDRDGEGDVVAAMKDVSIWSRTSILIYSPVITAGCSYEEKHFHTLFFYGFSSKSTGSVRAALQMTSRVRDLADKEIHVFIHVLETGPDTRSKIELLPSPGGDGPVQTLAVAIECIDEFRKRTFVEKTTSFVSAFLEHKVNSGFILEKIPSSTDQPCVPKLAIVPEYTHPGQQIESAPRTIRRLHFDALKLVHPSQVATLNDDTLSSIREYVLSSSPFPSLEKERVTRTKPWLQFLILATYMHFDPECRPELTWELGFRASDETVSVAESWIKMFKMSSFSVAALSILWKLACLLNQKFESEKAFRDGTDASLIDRLTRDAKREIRDIAILNSRILKQNEFRHSKHSLTLTQGNATYVDFRDESVVEIRYSWFADPLMFGPVLRHGLVLQLSRAYLWHVDTDEEIVAETGTEFPWQRAYTFDGEYCVGTFTATLDAYDVTRNGAGKYVVTHLGNRIVTLKEFITFIKSLCKEEVIVGLGVWKKCALFEHIELMPYLHMIYDLGLLLDCVVLNDPGDSPFQIPSRVFGSLVHHGATLVDAFIDAWLSDTVSYMLPGNNLVSKTVEGGLLNVMECKSVCFEYN